MAEHILLELTAILDEISESWTAETMADVKESVVALMEAAGEIVSAEDRKNLPLGALVEQRDTYSKYYAGNCFKGGIFIQLCGWMGNYDLWGGNVSDTKYNNDAGYLQDQAVFQRHDLVDGAVVPWTNVFDKGYRARAACLRAEGQLTSQPEYAKSDQRFKGSETMYSASIASDRGSNERGVNVSKRSGMIKRGFQANMDAKLFQDVWIAWGFQVNFMYNPVV